MATGQGIERARRLEALTTLQADIPGAPKYTKADAPKKVKIGPITLGVKKLFNPDKSRPNPISIEWSQDNEIAVKPCVGDRPKTECTIEDGLNYCIITFNTLDKDLLREVRKLKAGPHMVETYYETMCMYIKGKKIRQNKGTRDPVQEVVITLMEANDG